MLLTKVLYAFNKLIPFCQMADGQLGALSTHAKFINQFHYLLFCRSRFQRNIVQPLSITDLNFNEQHVEENPECKKEGLLVILNCEQ